MAHLTFITSLKDDSSRSLLICSPSTRLLLTEKVLRLALMILLSESGMLKREKLLKVRPSMRISVILIRLLVLKSMKTSWSVAPQTRPSFSGEKMKITVLSSQLQQSRTFWLAVKAINS
jgi:hypothetical protein